MVVNRVVLRQHPPPELSGDRNQVGQFMNDRRGQMIATSVGATGMGRGCDTAILDDPVSAAIPPGRSSIR
jgi:hypothetical protein